MLSIRATSPKRGGDPRRGRPARTGYGLTEPAIGTAAARFEELLAGKDIPDVLDNRNWFGVGDFFAL